MTATTDLPDAPESPIGIIGGSGLYSLLDSPESVEVETPFGFPSENPQRGTFGGKPVVFLPRHGADHRLPPHRVNYRANLWALRALGVRRVLAPSAVGGLVPQLGPGSVVVPDQLIDLTWGRAHTVYDAVGPVVHVGFADPYCPLGRATAVAVDAPATLEVVDGGTMVVIQGPRFSTRAESRRNAADGGTVVGMTGAPEAQIARELAMCFTSLALVTDSDAGVDAASAVSHAAVLEAFAANVEHVGTLLGSVVAALPDDAGCACRHAVDGLPLPFELP
ncbi:S-methyl-5'-thioadenosine phosphorylase [Cellulomonas sp. PhB143]|uniref:S-methyl-5'-thioadenosine phosphorylase n=1 Tax=Cellulomonas sp. PhB143 TaxID=2485186 RepID=UPI000FB4E236|nr:S-methyl-5'-thioadenosine phosphorylase [Cellulomonas sp. PhB143]ROS72058.1 5'-methylthioadenosine phosphorylase [Cellulomonas sp. PhB143]